MSLTALQLQSPIIHVTDEQGEVIKNLAKLLMQASNTRPSMLTSEQMVPPETTLEAVFLEISTMSLQLPVEM